MPYYFDKGRPTQNIKELKNELRSKFREKRKSLSPELKMVWDEQICRRISSLLSVRYADCVLSFSPLSGEVDVSEFNSYVLKNDKELYLPRCKPGTREMSFHLISDFGELESGSFSIMEPNENAPVWQSANGKRTVCIIPAMSYDKNGFRLGYGKGYYDRYLSSKDVLKIGVCYTQFLSDNIPRGRFDLSVDIIVTEKGVITVQK
jgi:5-formyltetrahydrofolate cyclo-ligase